MDPQKQTFRARRNIRNKLQGLIPIYMDPAVFTLLTFLSWLALCLCSS